MQRNFLFLALISSLFAFSYCNAKDSSEKNSNKYVPYVKKVTSEFIKEVKNESDLICSGTGGGMPYNVESIFVSFISLEPASINKARELELFCINKLLRIVNNSKKLRPYLSDYPFTYKNIDISIVFLDQSGDYHQDGEVSHVFRAKNKVFYYKKDPKTRKQVSSFEETFEEALEIINQKNDSLDHPTKQAI